MIWSKMHVSLKNYILIFSYKINYFSLSLNYDAINSDIKNKL